MAERIAGAERMVVVTHIHPDGDALGSMVALARAARAAGKTADVVAGDDIARRYRFLLEGESPLGFEQFRSAAERADTVVVIDTCSSAQLAPLADQLKKQTDKVLVIDHHQNCEPIGSLQWVEPDAAAVGVMIYEMLKSLDWSVDATTAEALAAAALSDTGWMRFSNTDGRCLRAVADWMDAGVRPDRLYRKIYQADRPERLRLLMRMLNALELRAEGRLAASVLWKADFVVSGATENETEDLVNEPMRLRDVEISALVIETDNGSRVSLRSREFVDVAEVARRFGGGGHARAAGLRSDEPPNKFAKKLFAACEKAIKAAAP